MQWFISFIDHLVPWIPYLLPPRLMTWWLIAILFPWWYPCHDCHTLFNVIYCFYCTTVINTIIISSPKDPARFIFYSCCSICVWPRWILDGHRLLTWPSLLLSLSILLSFLLLSLLLLWLEAFSFNLDLDLRFSAKQSKDPPNDVDDWHPWVEFLSYGQLPFGIFQPILIFLELLWVCLAFSEASQRRAASLTCSNLRRHFFATAGSNSSSSFFWIVCFCHGCHFALFFQISITDLTIIYLLLNWIWWWNEYRDNQLNIILNPGYFKLFVEEELMFDEGGGDGGWA